MICTGMDTTALAERIAGAQHRVVLHAALYSRFAADADMVEALHALLQKQRGNESFKGVHCICLDSTLLLESACGWISDFLSMLRPTATGQDLLCEFAASDAFTLRLEMEYRGIFFRHLARTRPAAPILIVDNLILCGHYLHAGIPAPDGYWFNLSAPVEELLDHARNGTQPSSPDHKAALRFVADCHAAMHQARPIHTLRPMHVDAAIDHKPLQDCRRGLRA